jgi:TPR repeat protein
MVKLGAIAAMEGALHIANGATKDEAALAHAAVGVCLGMGIELPDATTLTNRGTNAAADAVLQGNMDSSKILLNKDKIKGDLKCDDFEGCSSGEFLTLNELHGHKGQRGSGACTQHGRSAMQDNAQAFVWCRKAADQGKAIAQK